MSIWSDDPEYFDEWIEQRALKGDFGEEIKTKVLNGDLMGGDLWAMKELDPLGELNRQACEDYSMRFGE